MYVARICSTSANLQIVLNTHENPYLDQTTPPQKYSNTNFYHPHGLESGVLPPPRLIMVIFISKYFDVCSCIAVIYYLLLLVLISYS